MKQNIHTFHYFVAGILLYFPNYNIRGEQMGRPATREKISKFCQKCDQQTDHCIIKRPKSRNGGRGHDIICSICLRNRGYNRYITNLQKWIEYKGGKCNQCGLSDDTCVYDFHHRDPTDKQFNINSLYSYAFDSVKKELDKCDLLCSNCHRKTTKKSLYSPSRKSRRKTIRRYCKQCQGETSQIVYPESRRECGVNYHCVDCTRRRSQNRHTKQSIKCFVYKGGKCYCCGIIDDMCIYDYHHIEQSQKMFNIARKYSISFDNLRKELDKCVLLCSNCHRKVNKNLIQLEISNVL